MVVTGDGTIYAGGIARGTQWEFIERVSGLTRIRLSDGKVFEPLAVRIRSNGLELEFTQPLAAGGGWDPAGYYVTQWGYQPVQTYGGPKVRHRRGEVRSATVSENRRRVFLELPDLVTGEVIHVRLPESLASAGGNALWSGDAWYTVNRIPTGQPGTVRPRPADIARTTAPFFRFEGGGVGRTLYQNFCAACHSLDGSPLVGPSFQKLLGADRKVLDAASGRTKEVRADTHYIRQSIVEPNALVVEGYQDIMPPLGSALSDKEVDALVEFVEGVARAAKK
jgi:cytochrome c